MSNLNFFVVDCRKMFQKVVKEIQNMQSPQLLLQLQAKKACVRRKRRRTSKKTEVLKRINESHVPPLELRIFACTEKFSFLCVKICPVLSVCCQSKKLVTNIIIVPSSASHRTCLCFGKQQRLREKHNLKKLEQSTEILLSDFYLFI